MAEFYYDDNLTPEINKYLAILRKDPGAMVFAPLAEAYRKAGMLDEAISTAKEGLRLHPNYVSGMVALGRAYFEKGRFVEAKETLGNVLVIAPDNIIAANILEEIKQKPADKAYGSTYAPKPELVAPVPATASTEDEGVWLGAEEPEVIEPVELEEIEAIPEAEGLGADESEATAAYGEKISEELWTGEAVHEAPAPAEEDVRPKKEITTSTIADLYIKQGYLDKAIDIYQTLYDADPYNEDIKSKLDELKKGVEAESEGQKPKAERVESAGVKPEVNSRRETRAVVEEKKPAEKEGPDDENIKRLESWLKTIQSERH